MISCQTFRADLQPGNREPELLEHLRKCDACLEYAVSTDPDNFFRAIGGEELVPPGGVEAFTAEVMAQVRMRQTEGSMAHRFLIAPRRLAAAAAVIVAIGVSALVYDSMQKSAPVQPQSITIARRPVQLATKPIVETYQSRNATIVEIPESNVVMIFDDSLPADL